MSEKIENIKNLENTDNKITIKDFVKKYNALTNDKLKENQIDKIIKRHYVPVVEKRVAAEVVLEKSTHEENGIKYIDSFLSQIGLTSAILSLYTNLDTNGNIFDNYDLLMESDIYPIILYKIGERDIKETMRIYSSVEETFVNQQSFEGFFSKQVTRFGELFGTLAGSGMEALAKSLADEEKIGTLAKSIDEMIKTKKINIIK